MAKAMFIFSLFIFAALNAGCPEVIISEIPEMNEQEIEALNGGEVKIRGFLYAGSDQRLILDSSPNLKSCCVGAEKKIKHQVIVKDLLDGADGASAVLVQGTFLVRPEFDDNGKMIQYAVLTRSELVDESRWGGIGAFAAMLAAFPAYFLARKWFM